MTLADAPPGRPAASRGRAQPLPPVPPPRPSAQRARPPRVAERPVPPPRPRVPRADPEEVLALRAARRRQPPPRGRVDPAAHGSALRRFVRRWGWRAYAIPLLTIATVATLADIVVSGRAPAARAAAPTTAASPTVQVATPTHVSAAPAGEAEPTAPVVVPAEAAFVEQGAGTVSVVDGTSAVYGTGALERFVVEVEDGIGVDGAAFATAVETTLGDPRSWGHGGAMSFQRVGAAEAQAGQYDFRVTLVSPGNMEKYCPGVGTGGYTSCRYGERAVINLARWETAVPDYAGDVATYRLYVVNHEVGHALGRGHQQCPGPGQLAPVMQQQTLGLDGCAKNAWPYP